MLRLTAAAEMQAPTKDLVNMFEFSLSLVCVLKFFLIILPSKFSRLYSFASEINGAKFSLFAPS